MQESNINQPQKPLHKLLIRAYHAKEAEGNRISGRSPLDIPGRTVFYSFLAAVGISLLVGNIFIHLLHGLIGWWDLPEIESRTAFIGVKDNNRHIAVVDYLLPDWKGKLAGADSTMLSKLKNSFKDNEITVVEVAKFIGKPEMSDELKKLIIGKIDRSVWTLGLIPVFSPESPDKIADSEKIGLYKSYEVEVGETDSLTWKRFIFISAIQHLRSEMNADIGHPRRMLLSLSGTIQWITFLAAVWCLLLLLALRLPWCNLQRFITVNNHLPWDAPGNDVWNIRSTYFSELDKPANYPGMILNIRLIKDVLNIFRGDKSASVYNSIRERIEAYRNSIELGEYEIINFLIWAAPTFGFLGTIFGIISAMENAAAIFSATDKIEQVIALDKVSAALGTAFDTSFIALLWLVPMSYFLAKTRKAEANLFEELEHEAVGNIPPQLEGLAP